MNRRHGQILRAGLMATVFVGMSGAPPPHAADTPPAPPPLIADYPMEPDAAHPDRLTDAGPLALNGRLEPGATFVPGGHRGQALRLDGEKGRAVVESVGLMNRAGDAFTFSAWIRPDAAPPQGRNAWVMTKRPVNWMGKPFSLGVGDNRRLLFEGVDSRGWGPNLGSEPVVEIGRWSHVAITYKAGGEEALYLDGKEVARKPAGYALAPNDQALYFGFEDGSAHYAGLIDDARFYAAALTPNQLQADMAGTLATRPTVAADFPPPKHYVNLSLVRFDSPKGFTEHYGSTRQLAERRPGPDAVDWPTITVEGAPLFQKSAEDGREFLLREDPMSRPLFRQPYDPALQPGDHWLRPVAWLWGRRYVYTTDRTARSWEGDYELWTFPVRVQGEGAADVKNVVLSVGGQEVVRAAGPLHSLTLLLPQNVSGKPYTLTVDGREPVTFDAGLRPVTPGSPKDQPIPIHLTLPGAGPTLTVASVDRPDRFPNAKEWADDLIALNSASRIPAQPPVVPQRKGMARHLGLDVPLSPLATYNVSLTHGMSLGHFFFSEQGPAFGGTLEEYARHLAALGYDRVFEQVFPDRTGSPQDPRGYDRWMATLAAQGVQGGLNPLTLSDPNQAFYSYSLPDYHQPKYRDAQLLLQRFGRYPNLAGITMGADNAAYVPYWDWAPPIPNRPWGEAFLAFNGDRPPTVPVGPSIPNPLAPHEVRAADTRAFVEYLHRYDETFRQYGYFAHAAAEVNPALAFTTGSFGSSPGVGGRGGWPWASVPGKPIFEGLPVLQAYDWNEQASSRPMHNEALMDRLRSVYPKKPAWALLDEFKLFFGREARQRAYALALTRGLKAIGTNSLVHSTGPAARPPMSTEFRELNDWIHRFGGAYAMTEPMPSIGILYVHPQELLRRPVRDEFPGEEELTKGSHEGKVTEAFFMCHAAGWPAKVVTPDELKRGLAPSVTALLLVGLNRFDSSWVWYEGMEPLLDRFAKGGGRILTDNETTCPAPCVNTGMNLAAYVINSGTDATPMMIARNADNFVRLRKAMAGVPPPLAVSTDPTVWAVPTVAGDTQYVTVINQASESGQNASKVVKPQTGALTWNTSRPIYDTRLGRKISPEEAAHVDLTRDAFRYYALPPAEVTPPQVLLNRDDAGFFEAHVSIVHPRPMSGIPLQFTVTQGTDTAIVYGATGLLTRLPVRDTDTPGRYTLTVKELLSGLTRSVIFTVKPGAARRDAEAVRRAQAIRAFLARKTTPLTLALTPRQAANPKLAAVADQLVAWLTARGRKPSRGIVEPGGVILSLQPVQAIQRYPQWRSIPSDLALLGAPSDNVLVLDQARGYLLPEEPAASARGTAAVTFSPFEGGYQALNLLGADEAALQRAMTALTRDAAPPQPASGRETTAR